MMKSYLIVIAILLKGQLAFCQVKSVLIDSKTKEKISYVNIWVENENIGTTSNDSGEFELNLADTKKIIVFSAIGYTTKKMVAGDIGNIIELIPNIIVLQEVFIRPKKDTKELVIESFKKSETNHFFVGGTTPWIVAKYFTYEDNYKTTPYLKKIRIITNSEIRQASFNIRLYSVNENGDPGEYLYDKNIIGVAKKGKTITEVDLSGLNIQFPENGFFIAYEWLIIESNKYEFTYTRQGSNEKFKGIRYEPGIGTFIGNEQKNSWTYIKGGWYKWIGQNEGKYRFLAIELTLTN
ncbi:MAG: carboxypeptidase-like regulatory domain-containing protein [Ginsengibacter sp.]